MLPAFQWDGDALRSRTRDQAIGVTQYCDYPQEARTRHVVSKGVIDIYRTAARRPMTRSRDSLRQCGSVYAFDTEWLNEGKSNLILTRDMCKSCNLDAKDVFYAIEKIEPKPRFSCSILEGHRTSLGTFRE